MHLCVDLVLSLDQVWNKIYMLKCKTKSKGRCLGSRELTKGSTHSHSPARQLSENEAHPLSFQILCKGKNKEGAQW